MQRKIGRLDFGSVGLAMLAGAAISMGLIQLLSTPLDAVANVDVQELSVQATVLVAPLMVCALLLLRDGPQMVHHGSRLASKPPRWLWVLWLQEAPGLGLNMISLMPYTLAAALVGAMVTRPKLDSFSELSLTVGGLEPLMLLFALLKTGLFSITTLWIALHQGARARRRGLPQAAGLSRAITITLAVVLVLDLAWALAVDPLLELAGV